MDSFLGVGIGIGIGIETSHSVNFFPRMSCAVAKSPMTTRLSWLRDRRARRESAEKGVGTHVILNTPNLMVVSRT